MSREFQDEDLQTWEVYATPGDFGFPDHARIVFHCVTHPGLKARVFVGPGDRADAEARVATATHEELAGMLAEAEEVK